METTLKQSEEELQRRSTDLNRFWSERVAPCLEQLNTARTALSLRPLSPESLLLSAPPEWATKYSLFQSKNVRVLFVLFIVYTVHVFLDSCPLLVVRAMRRKVRRSTACRLATLRLAHLWLWLKVLLPPGYLRRRVCCSSLPERTRVCGPTKLTLAHSPEWVDLLQRRSRSVLRTSVRRWRTWTRRRVLSSASCARSRWSDQCLRRYRCSDSDLSGRALDCSTWLAAVWCRRWPHRVARRWRSARPVSSRSTGTRQSARSVRRARALHTLSRAPQALTGPTRSARYIISLLIYRGFF